MIPEAGLDNILALQVAVARLGEKTLRFWWNSDIVDVDGGADLLSRLVGKEMAPLAVIEGVLLVATQAEERLLSPIPFTHAYSLFCPEPGVRKALRQRFRHFKTYPDELPESLEAFVTDDLSESDLIARIKDAAHTSATAPAGEEQTSFGIELKIEGNDHDQVKLALALAAIALRSPRGSYTLPYFRGAVGV